MTNSGVVLVAGADLVTMFSEHLFSLTQSLPTRVSSPASLTDARARHTVTRAPALTLTPRLTVLTIGAGGTLVLTHVSLVSRRTMTLASHVVAASSVVTFTLPATTSSECSSSTRVGAN